VKHLVSVLDIALIMNWSNHTDDLFYTPSERRYDEHPILVLMKAGAGASKFLEELQTIKMDKKRKARMVDEYLGNATDKAKTPVQHAGLRLIYSFYMSVASHLVSKLEDDRKEWEHFLDVTQQRLVECARHEAEINLPSVLSFVSIKD